MDTKQELTSVSGARKIDFPLLTGPQPNPMTADPQAWEAFISAFISRKTAKHPTTDTANVYRRSLKPLQAYFLARGITNPTQITEEDLEAFRGHLQSAVTDKTGKRATDATASGRLGIAKQFFHYLAVKDQMPKDISRDVDGISPGSEFTKAPLGIDQVRDVMAQISSPRDRALMLLLFTTGLRCVEIVRANVEDLNLWGSTQILKVQGKGHHDKDQSVNVPPETMKAILAYLATRGNPADTDPLFSSEANRNRGQRLTTISVSRLVKDYFRKAGWESDQWTAHSTRHTFATMALESGVPVQTVQMLLRHANVNTTMRYIHQRDKYSNRTTWDVEKMILDTPHCQENLNS